MTTAQASPLDKARQPQVKSRVKSFQEHGPANGGLPTDGFQIGKTVWGKGGAKQEDEVLGKEPQECPMQSQPGGQGNAT